MDELQNEILKKFKKHNQVWATAVSEAINKNEVIDLGNVQEESINIISEIPGLISEAKKRNKKKGFFK